ncbi:hypothetical protein [Trinickia acidisoli]|uniref:hypothetical protein n=1 Tax=Trinickia acidisoli TaxID=2767482 RepID=UPI001A8CF1A1|nr:hypothetical protein [Trinickia acidisoli]
MSSEIGASRLAALGEVVAVDDMIKKLGDAADYKGYAASRGGWRRLDVAPRAGVGRLVVGNAL